MTQPRRIPPGSVETFLEARALLALLGPDLDAERHWEDMGRALGVVCKLCTEQSRAGGLCQNHYRRHLRKIQRDLRAHPNEAARINRLAKEAS